MRLLVDTTPLRVSRDFRRLWIGQGVSFLGSTITMAALPYQVFHATGSTLAVGLLGLAYLGPLLACSLFGGAIADRSDKRLLLLAANGAALACSAALAANAALDQPQVWLMFVLGALAAGIYAVTYPVTRSLLPLLIEENLRTAAYALQATYGSFGMMVGPAIGGVIIATFGLTAAYCADVASFCVALALFTTLAPSPPLAPADRSHAASVLEGLRYLRGQSVIMSVFAIDLLAMVFGMPRALLPALAVELGGGPKLYGLLLASIAARAFVASLSSGWTGRVRREGRAVLWAVTVWGAAIAVAGLSHATVLVLAMFAVAGGADMISGVFRSTIAASVTRDEMRGRVSGVEIAVYAGGPVLGDIEAGVVGGLAGVPFAIVSGGIACIVAAGAFAVRARSFAEYERPDAASPETSAEHEGR